MSKFRRITSPSGTGQQTRGFTLIELLVVISIVVLLVSILLPALGRARESSRRVKCLTNLKGIGVGLELYMSTEGKGMLPKVRPLNSGTNTNDPSLLQVLSKYTDAAVPFEESPGEWAVTDPWRCPSDLKGADAATGFKPVWRTSGTSYEYVPGISMLAAELFLIRQPQLGVSKAFEQFRPPLVVLFDAENWHHPRFDINRRTGGNSNQDQQVQWDRNGLFYGDWRADRAPFLDNDITQRLFADIVQFGGGIGS